MAPTEPGPKLTDAQIATILVEEAIFRMEGPIINRARRLVEAYRGYPPDNRPYTFEWAWAVFQLAHALEAAGVPPDTVALIAQVHEDPQ